MLGTIDYCKQDLQTIQEYIDQHTAEINKIIEKALNSVNLKYYAYYELQIKRIWRLLDIRGTIEEELVLRYINIISNSVSK